MAKTGVASGGGCFLASLVLGVATVCGWLTHIVYCFQNEKWLLLVAGAIAAPIGTVHGWGIWFGWWG
jgi:uncharacterized membrane protein